jgi:hypothetical protein
VAWLLLVILAALAFLATRAAADDNVPGDAASDGDDDHDDDTHADPAIPDVDVALPEAPPIAAVIAAGYAAAGLDRDPSHNWNTRARLAGLVPQVTVADGIDSSWHDIDPNIGRRQIFEVRATWRFDRLLFDTNELHVATIEASRRREKRRIASVVIRAYFTWRRAAAAATREPKWTSPAAEAAAQLDALTDGWFSAELTSRRHGMSGRRTAGPSVGLP